MTLLGSGGCAAGVKMSKINSGVLRTTRSAILTTGSVMPRLHAAVGESDRVGTHGRQIVVTALAIVLPPEASGLHRFWAARWAALRRAGVDVHPALPKNVDPPALRSIPAEYLHRVQYGRPPTATRVLSNLEYLGRLRRDSARLAAVANRVDARTVISHGPHMLTPATLARRFSLHHLLLLHSGSGPRWTAAAVRWVRRPDQVLAETKTAEGAYAAAFGVPHPSTLLPATIPTSRQANQRLLGGTCR